MAQTAAGLADLAELADLLEVLIRLHDREADAALIDGLRQIAAAEWFAAALAGAPGQAAAARLGAALDALPTPVAPATLDALAVEYADIYLTHGYRISPSGSVWLTEDHLERQMPMFEVREFYAHYDITVPDWRIRADDHLVHELQFVAHLLREATEVSATDAARFLDAHVLCWMPAFFAQGMPRLREPLYQALFALTEALLDDVRDRLEALLDLPREVREVRALGAERVPEEADAAYMPGVAESW